MNQADNNTYAIASLSLMVTRSWEAFALMSQGLLDPADAFAHVGRPWSEADVRGIAALFEFEEQDKENFEKLLDRLKKTW